MSMKTKVTLLIGVVIVSIFVEPARLPSLYSSRETGLDAEVVLCISTYARADASKQD